MVVICVARLVAVPFGSQVGADPVAHPRWDGERIRPYDDAVVCEFCGDDGRYVGHEDECYATGDCHCSGVQVECECGQL